MNMNIEDKVKMLINFIERFDILMADIYKEGKINDGKEYKLKLVPHDYDIEKIPIFKKYCKLMGLECSNTFLKDEERTNGYYQYHQCILKDDGTLYKNKLLEELNEEN